MILCSARSALVLHFTSEGNGQGVHWTCRVLCLFMVEALKSISLEPPKLAVCYVYIFALYTQHVPIQCSVFQSGDVTFRSDAWIQLSPPQDHCCPPQYKHPAHFKLLLWYCQSSLFLHKTVSVQPVILSRTVAASVLVSSEKLEVLFLTIKTTLVTLPYLRLSNTVLSTNGCQWRRNHKRLLLRHCSHSAFNSGITKLQQRSTSKIAEQFCVSSFFAKH